MAEIVDAVAAANPPKVVAAANAAANAGGNAAAKAAANAAKKKNLVIAGVVIFVIVIVVVIVVAVTQAKAKEQEAAAAKAKSDAAAAKAAEEAKAKTAPAPSPQAEKAAEEAKAKTAPAPAGTATPWKCVQGFNAPMRKDARGDVQCMSNNHKDCTWKADPAQCQAVAATPVQPLDPLTCGEGHKAAWGSPGYDNPDHWCSQVKKLI
jgi:cytoskeletal protein RodZ